MAKRSPTFYFIYITYTTRVGIVVSICLICRLATTDRKKKSTQTRALKDSYSVYWILIYIVRSLVYGSLSLMVVLVHLGKRINFRHKTDLILRQKWTFGEAYCHCCKLLPYIHKVELVGVNGWHSATETSPLQTVLANQSFGLNISFRITPDYLIRYRNTSSCQWAQSVSRNLSDLGCSTIILNSDWRLSVRKPGNILFFILANAIDYLNTKM